MFDWINFKCDCPDCGSKMDSFQSKCGPCTLATLEPWMVDNFYDSCNNCKTWVEYFRNSSVSEAELIYGGLLTTSTLRDLVDAVEEGNQERIDKTVMTAKAMLVTSKYPKADEWLDLYKVKITSKA